ncbi:MAG: cupin domain-containing protein [Gemmatimonadaceae bacterium]
MHAFEIPELRERHDRHGDRYIEFLRVRSLSAGLYVLPAGSTDTQLPHAQDEVYYIVSGRASIRVEAEDRAIASGSIVYVPANAEHRFHSIEEQLEILVFFAPAENR